MLPDGNFLATVASTQWGKTKSGVEQIVIDFKIIEGIHEGERILWYGYFSAGAAERTLKSLRACGWRGSDLSRLGTLDLHVEIIVEGEEYMGKTRQKVKWINQPGSTALKNPLADSELKSLAERMKATAALLPEAKDDANPF